MLSIHDDMTIKWYNDGDRYCLHIRQDKMPDDPRKQDDDGRVTTMACWHSRYGLGDDIGKVDPDEFWRELVRKNVPESEILDAAEAGKLNGIRIAKNLEGENLVDIYETAQWRTVLGNSEPEEILEYEGVLRDAAAEYLMDALTIGHCQTLMQPYAEWLPLWLYDHSGITMSCGTRAYPYSDRWDSGQVGFIIVLKDRIVSARCLDPNDDGWREMAIEEMTAEVRTYDEYLTGDVYWFQVHKFDLRTATGMKSTATAGSMDMTLWKTACWIPSATVSTKLSRTTNTRWDRRSTTRIHTSSSEKTNRRDTIAGNRNLRLPALFKNQKRRL